MHNPFDLTIHLKETFFHMFDSTMQRHKSKIIWSDCFVLELDTQLTFLNS